MKKRLVISLVCGLFVCACGLTGCGQKSKTTGQEATATGGGLDKSPDPDDPASKGHVDPGKSKTN